MWILIQIYILISRLDITNFLPAGNPILNPSELILRYAKASSPLLFCPKTAPCPEATQGTATAAGTTAQAADHCKAFPEPLRARF